MSSRSTVHLLVGQMESLSRTLWARYGTSSTDADVEKLLDDCSDGNPLRDRAIIRREAESKCILEGAPSWNADALYNSTLIARRVWSLIWLCLQSLRPSFCLPSTKPRKLHKTSYLDGLRGVAALLVVVHHYSVRFTIAATRPWGSQEGEGENNWFFQLPIARVVHSGPMMVGIFFVISGYVLSYRGLKLAREGKAAGLLDSLASSVFRRWIRLHLPVIVSTFTAFLMARANLWTNLPEGWEPMPPGWTSSPLPVPEGNFTMQFWDWYADTAQLCDPFRYGVKAVSKYSINNLWTIPLEWMNSMLVFVVVLAISRTKTWVKLAVLSFLIYWCHRTLRWDPAVFLSGVLLAEMSFIRADYPLSVSEKARPHTLHACLFLASRVFWTSLFILGIYIGSMPVGATSSRGYMTFMSYVPVRLRQEVPGGFDFWMTTGSIIIVFSLENAPYLQRIFTTPFAQYLGDISFSIYLLHAQIEYTLGQWIVPKCMAITGGWANGQLGFIAGMVLASLAFVPITFWASDLFTRAVDRKSVNFAKWVHEKVFVGS